MWNTRNLLIIALVCFLGSLLYSCNKVDLPAEKISINQNEEELSLINMPNSKSKRKILLGKLIFFDKNLSESGGSETLVQSCASCHLPQQGFAAFAEMPLGGIPRGFKSSFAEGAVAGRLGGRKPPSAAYATFSPILFAEMDEEDPEEGVEFKGGLFWDGRATGARLGSPAAEQALGPFLNPVEQNHKLSREVLLKIQNNTAYYDTLWKAVWGTPLNITESTSEAEINMNYDRVGLAIAAFEASKEVNKFRSKFDKFVKNEDTLTTLERQGLELFDNKAKCGDCHEISSDGEKSLFTDFSYYNLGLPANPESPFGGPDFGLGAFLRTLNSSNPKWYSLADENLGKFKTPTLRNVAKGSRNKRFMHNGVFKSLEEVVHFYNTRDVPGAGWAPPEVSQNMETKRMGNLGLTAYEEAAIVAFLKTLSDK